MFLFGKGGDQGAARFFRDPLGQGLTHSRGFNGSFENPWVSFRPKGSPRRGEAHFWIVGGQRAVRLEVASPGNTSSAGGSICAHGLAVGGPQNTKGGQQPPLGIKKRR